MTDTVGPFDNAQWSQDQWYRHAPKWAPSGVNGSPASSSTTGDLPITFSGLNFTIGIGRAWVRGAGFERTGSPASQAIPANTNASLFRRDRIVLRRDLAAKTVAPVLIQGTASSSPTAPALQQNETGQWDLPLFSVLTPPNSGTTITGIVDERAFIGPDGQVTVGSVAARDAISAYDGMCVYVKAAGKFVYCAAGPAWVALGAWFDFLRNGTFNFACPSSTTTLPGHTLTLLVPAGRTLDVEWKAPKVLINTSGGVQIQLVINGAVADTYESSTGSYGAFWNSARVNGSLTVSSDTTLTYSVQAAGLGGGAQIFADVGAVVLRHRIV